MGLSHLQQVCDLHVVVFADEELEALVQQALHQLWKEKFLVPPEIQLLLPSLTVDCSNEQSVPNSLWSPKKSFCLAVLGFPTVSRLSEEKHPSNRTDQHSSHPDTALCLLPALQRALAAPAQLWEAALGVDRRAFGRGGACTAWLKLQAGSQPDPRPGPGLGSVFHLLASVIPITKNSLKT